MHDMSRLSPNMSRPTCTRLTRHVSSNMSHPHAYKTCLSQHVSHTCVVHYYISKTVNKPSPARGRCPPELGRGGWSKRASPDDRQGFESGRIQYPAPYVVGASHPCGTRWAERRPRSAYGGEPSRTDLHRSFRRWGYGGSKVRRREARPIAAATEAWLVAGTGERGKNPPNPGV